MSFGLEISFSDCCCCGCHSNKSRKQTNWNVYTVECALRIQANSTVWLPNFNIRHIFTARSHTKPHWIRLNEIWGMNFTFGCCFPFDPFDAFKHHNRGIPWNGDAHWVAVIKLNRNFPNTFLHDSTISPTSEPRSHIACTNRKLSTNKLRKIHLNWKQ